MIVSRTDLIFKLLWYKYTYYKQYNNHAIPLQSAPEVLHTLVLYKYTTTRNNRMTIYVRIVLR